ncbi:zinc finger protein 501 [Musca domestica]|uniref:Zinc finger protein 501 n=1 Tax=Musca domestica TaxID=7370 RepID=A0A9J7I811_MUSDO|nr:zinc finger protein 501 [Musca domestica]
MSEEKFCCLCVTLSSAYKELFNKSGGETAFYDITFKYFDPVLLNAEDDKESNVVCLACWNTINDFYEFQNVIQNAHKDLQESLREIAREALNDECENDLEENNLDSQTIENGTANEGQMDDSKEDEYCLGIDDDKVSLQLKRKQSLRKGTNSKTEKQNRKIEKENIEHGAEDSNSSEVLNIDEIIAKWKPSLECVICSITTTTFGLLRTHFRIHHPGQKCYITCCERKFSKRCDVYEHIQLHLDPSTFKCKVCGKCSTNSRNLAKHMRDLHSERGKIRPFECGVCQKCFPNKTKLRIHMDVHKTEREYACSICGKGFSTEQRKKVHENLVHNVDKVCELCGKTIHGIYALKQHLLEHQGVEKPKWPCDQCNVQLYSHTSLKRHKQFRHNDGSTTHICSECGKKYQSETALNSHKRLVHILERKHKCTICDKSFKLPKVLREHMASHEGKNLYQCPHCPKTYRMSSNLYHHRRKAHPNECLKSKTNKPVTSTTSPKKN